MTAPMTVASNLNALCPVAEFLKRCDQRTVGDWASDTGVRILPGSLTTNPNVLAALMDASGDTESAALIGGKYSATDLLTLSNTTCVSQAKLFRIVSDIALCYLYERRPAVHKDAQPPPSWQRATLWLEQLAQGTRIFSFKEASDAGRMDIQAQTISDIHTRNGVVLQATPFFGIRSDRQIPYQTQGPPAGPSGGDW